MGSSSLTKGRGKSSNLHPLNLQVIIDNSVSPDILSPYMWAIGLADFGGDVICSYVTVKLREYRPVNEDGILVYQGVMVDPRGGSFTLNGYCPNHNVFLGDPASNHDPNVLPFHLLKTCRYGRVDGHRLLFNASPIRSTVTATSIGPTNTISAGAKVGGDIGVVNVEGNSSFQRNFGSQNNADMVPGELVGISLAWTQG
jgi:hypothetical protein